jgi:hypothetical protein
MPSHIFIRLGLWDDAVASNRRAYEAGLHFSRSQGYTGVFYHEFHALDYMVYADLQRGRDSAADAIVAEARAYTQVRAPSPLVGSSNRTAMEARLPLERATGRRRRRCRSATPRSRYPRCWTVRAGIGAARSGNAPGEAGSRRAGTVNRPRRQERHLLGLGPASSGRHSTRVLLASGDTAGGAARGPEAADREDVTEKHPITPPSRRLR